MAAWRSKRGVSSCRKALFLALVATLPWSCSRGAHECRTKSVDGLTEVALARPGKSSEYHAYLEELQQGHKDSTILLATVLSCMVDVGTAVVVTDAGWASHTVEVTEGPDRGCTGDVAVEQLDCDAP